MPDFQIVQSTARDCFHDKPLLISRMPRPATMWLFAVLSFIGCSIFRSEPNPLPASIDTIPDERGSLPNPPVITNPSQAAKDFQTLVEADKRSARDIAQWLSDNRDAARRDAHLRTTLANRILDRLTEIREGYIRHIEAHPRHAEARLRFGNLLSRMQHDDEAVEQWSWAVKYDHQLAEAWNNIAGHLAAQVRRTRDPALLPRMFNSYDQALLHAPHNPLFPHNLATALGLFPADAALHYGVPRGEIPKMALGLLRLALSLAPDNFEIAADLAESHLDIKPFRKAQAQVAWDNARRLAREIHQYQQIDLQLALLEIEDAKPQAALRLLSKVTHPSLLPLKNKLLDALKKTRPIP